MQIPGPSPEYIWGLFQESVFLTGFHVMITLMVHEPHWTSTALEHVSKLWPRSKFILLPIFVKQVLLAQSHAHSFHLHTVWGCFCNITAELSSWIKHHIACSIKPPCCLLFHRKRLLILALKCHSFSYYLVEIFEIQK